MKKAKIETITLTLNREEAYALCNKLMDDALFSHGGYCEFDQIKMLQQIGKELGALVDHHASENNLEANVKGAVLAKHAVAENPKKQILRSLKELVELYEGR